MGKSYKTPPLKQRILMLLDDGMPRRFRTIGRELEILPEEARPVIRELVKAGWVVPYSGYWVISHEGHARLREQGFSWKGLA